MSTTKPDRDLDRYKAWFYSAAVYNLVWGNVVVLYPVLILVWSVPFGLIIRDVARASGGWAPFLRGD